MACTLFGCPGLLYGCCAEGTRRRPWLRGPKKVFVYFSYNIINDKTSYFSYITQYGVNLLYTQDFLPQVYSSGYWAHGTPSVHHLFSIDTRPACLTLLYIIVFARPSRFHYTMALPGLQPVRNSNSPRSRADIVATHDTEHSDRTRTPEYESLYKSQIKRATRTRKIFAILTSVFLFVAVIFVIMVEIGNTSNRSILRNIWFIKLNVTNVVPASFAQAGLVNSIARTLGLHDFYQVGLWNFCEGYNSQGVTGCSPTQTLYWFNPVQIIVNELLAGATSKCWRVPAYHHLNMLTPWKSNYLPNLRRSSTSSRLLRIGCLPCSLLELAFLSC